MSYLHQPSSCAKGCRLMFDCTCSFYHTAQTLVLDLVWIWHMCKLEGRCMYGGGDGWTGKT